MKILLCIFLLSSFAFSADEIDETAPDAPTEQLTDCPESAPIFDGFSTMTSYSSNWTITQEMPLGVWYAPEPETAPLSFRYIWLLDYYYASNAHIKFSSVTQICSPCTEANITAVPPAPPENPLYSWNIFGEETCNSSNIDMTAWLEYAEENRTSVSSLQNCCSNITYYTLVKIVCDANESLDENGICRETCGVDGILVDGDCLEQSVCKEGFVEYTSMTVVVGDGTEEPPNCDPIIIDGVSNEAYPLFPNVDEGDVKTCCEIPIPEENATTPPPDMGETNSILEGIRADIGDLATTNHTDLEGVRADIGEVKNSVDSVKNSVDEFATTTHTDLEGIKEGTDKIKELIEEGDEKREGINDTLTDLYSMQQSITDDRANIINQFNSIVNAQTNTSPIFVGSGSSTVTLSVYGSDVVLDFKIIETLRVAFDIIFFFLLGWFNFRIYLWIFKFIIELGGR